ncbi:MAG: glycosyltransferase [Bryobacterales bacterium]|nr:glycosyltransferase [Bryobacterales bacterium]
MKQRLRKLWFGLRGVNPDAVIVHFWTGDVSRARRMTREILALEPARRHFVVHTGGADPPPDCEPVPLPPASSGELWLMLRHRFRDLRVGLAPVLFDGTPNPLRAAAVAFAPGSILAFNANLERHHLRLRHAIASVLFLAGVPLDRIFLRPSWLYPFKRDRTRVPEAVAVVDGRPTDPSRPRVAVLSPYFPYPLAHGGAVRIFSLLREASREFDIFLFAFARDPATQEFEPLREFCAKIAVASLPHYREPRWATLAPPEVREFDTAPMRRLLREITAEAGITLRQVEYTQLAAYRGDILVEHDVTWDLYGQVRRRAPSVSAWWNWLRWRVYEARALRRFHAVVAMAEKDRALLGVPHARVIANGVDLGRFRPQPERPGRRLLFIGSFSHFPNVEAFLFFWREVWPNLAGVSLTVVGGPDHLLHWQRFTGTPNLPDAPGLRIHGFVRDVRPLYVEANVVVVPTTVSAGTNLKVLEGMAMERAIVSTPSGCAGIGLEDGRSGVIADSGPRFAQAIEALLAEPERRSAIAREARRLAEERYGWEALGAEQVRLWRELSTGRPRGAGGPPPPHGHSPRPEREESAPPGPPR